MPGHCAHRKNTWWLALALSLVGALHVRTAHAEPTRVALSDLRAPPSAKRVRERSVSASLLDYVRRDPIAATFLGRALDPDRHAFSFVRLCVSVNKRRGYGLFLKAHY
jgi:hypothetical protein